MILTLDKYPAASMLFNSARKACEAYIIFFYSNSFGNHVTCTAINAEKEQHIAQ